MDAVAREGVEVWRLGDGVAHKAHRIGAMIIGEDKNNVLGLRAGDAFGDYAGGYRNDGGAECGASEDEAGDDQTGHNLGSLGPTVKKVTRARARRDCTRIRM